MIDERGRDEQMKGLRQDRAGALYPVVALLALTLCGCAMFSQSAMPPPDPGNFWPNSVCKGCHDKIAEQHSHSHHEKSFDNPVFQAQYFQDVLPRAAKDPALIKAAEECTACHAPIFFMVNKTYARSKDEVPPAMSGVDCDFCHTISGYSGSMPGSGNYKSELGSDRKLGPFRHEYNWHHVYSDLHTKSEFCGICHNAVNRYGLEIKSTYSEWKGSVYAEGGIQCQNCHMNVKGFLSDGKAVYESGRAAYSRFGEQPYRWRLYTHRFPGAHSKTQMTSAGTLSVGLDIAKATASAGDEIEITVTVDNAKTGHKMPSGSTDLRMLWIELEARSGEKIVSIPASPDYGRGGFARAGEDERDKYLVGDDVPKSSRIYRAVMVDSSGGQTFSSHDAVKIIFDNRLEPAEIRKERYFYKIPEGLNGEMVIRARLMYQAYPSSFTRRYGLASPEPFEVSSSKKVIVVK